MLLRVMVERIDDTSSRITPPPPKKEKKTPFHRKNEKDLMIIFINVFINH